MDASPYLDNIQAVSNHEIRKRVSMLTVSMRGLESERRRRDSESHQKHWGTDNWFAASGAESEKTRNYVHEQFTVQMRPYGVALRDEIVRRLGTTPEEAKTHDAIHYGSLAGADPLEEAATNLEKLVRLLPN